MNSIRIAVNAVFRLVVMALLYALFPPQHVLAADKMRLMAERTAAFQKQISQVVAPSREEMTALILEKKYSEFEAIATRFSDDSQTNLPKEFAYRSLFNVYSPNKTLLNECVDQWVTEHPSWVSFGLRGLRRANLGHEARGDKEISETTKQQLDAMHNAFAQAKEDLQKAVMLNPHFISGYLALISIAQTEGGRNDLDAILREGLRFNPASYLIRYQYMQGLRPRWGGSWEEMQAYADSLNEAVKLNPYVWTLKGEVAAERGAVANLAKDYPAMVAHYTQALKYGDRNDFLYQRGNGYWSMGKMDLALADFVTCERHNNSYGQCSRARETVVRILEEQSGIRNVIAD